MFMKETDKIKVPRKARDSRVAKALAKIPRDGEWHRLLDMGFTSAEQTARGFNVPGGQWEFGYTHESQDADMVSVLWVRWSHDD